MRTVHRLPMLLGVAALLAVPEGCTRRHLVPQEFVLTPMTITAGSAGVLRNLSVGVGPVELPAYLRRPQIVTRESENELTMSAAHRWAEDLQTNISRVIAGNLSLLIPTNRVSTFPWLDARELDYRVSVRIEQFERLPNGKVSLEARWVLSRNGGDTADEAQRVAISTPTRNPKYPAMVAALGELSREVAVAIRENAR